MVEVTGAPGTLYANETYQLQVDFPENYPMEAPQVLLLSLSYINLYRLLVFSDVILLLSTVLQVIFLHPAPLHPHIYSNGHICLGMYMNFSLTVFCCLILWDILFVSVMSIFFCLFIFWHTLLVYGFVMCCCLYFLFVLAFMLWIVSDSDFCCNLLRTFL